MNHIHFRHAWPVQSRVHPDFKHALERFLNPSEARDASAPAPAWVPRVDVREEAERFVILADLPGVDPRDVEVLMDKGVLSIKGARAAVTADESARFSRVERGSGAFHRSFALPDSADADGITATGHNGVLEIAIPKRAASTPRRIQVGAQPT